MKKGFLQLTYITKVLKIREDLEKIKNEKQAVADEIKLSNEIFYASQESIAILDTNFNYLTVNPIFEQRTGFTTEEIKGKAFDYFNSGSQDKDFYDVIYDEVRKEGKAKAEIWSRSKEGSSYLEQVQITRMIDDDTNTVKNYLLLASDFTESKSKEVKMMSLAKHDHLTKLPNRSMFLDRLTTSLALSKRNKTTGAVMFMDLDHFKSLNDTLGHHVGDLLLIEIGHRLKKCTRESDTVARLAGDEFTILLPEITRSEDAAVVAENIINSLVKEYDLEGNKIKITCSVGIAIFPNDGLSVDELIHAADQAMYNVKKEGRNQYKFYSSSLDAEAHRKKSVEKELMNAIANDELYLQYLPAYTKDQKIAYFDVLIRWNHPVLGDVLPNEFIPLAEESGLIIKITDWVIKTSMKELKHLLPVFKKNHIKLSYKLSSIHFKQNNIVENILELIGKENVRMIQVKIDEPIISKNLVEAKEKIGKLIEQGFYVCIDDFGTGKISFLDILDLNFTSVKIPRELVKNINEHNAYAAAVKSLISLAKNLEAYITIEGIEFESQVESIMKYADDKMFLQGHYYSKPIKAKDVERII
jgi:diguanylate cyclase (GGDEF)-like protein/PAS domain S-box-containing protein